ncbi:DNA repair protein rad10 [Pleurotus eryngii]|uniref:DNA repair protein rad10 n=1 Tax=Pleurotus eryngii TaxID=5323 RepID=A0A9P6A7E9_PLEER|nr:DNA repair protein rad10 [Pleurotus eryngii]
MSSSTAKPPVVQPGAGNNIIISPTQRGNPVLECIRNVGKEFGDIAADYQVGRTTGVLFLSLKYHRLHPEYIHTRVEKLGHSYGLRIILIHCDVSEHREPIREITKMGLINNITVIVAFSYEDAGHYLSTFKQFEHKPPDLIKERVDKDHNSILRTALTTISRVNKTDVETLKSSFGSFANIAKASNDQLQNLPGFGQVKVKNIKNAFDKPFRNRATSTLPLPSMQRSALASGAPTLVASDPKGKGKQPARSPSLAWNIEDIDLDSPPGDPLIPPPPTSSKATGVDASTWDIELDLNDSD